MAFSVRHTLGCVSLFFAVFYCSSEAQEKFVMLLQPEDVQGLWRQAEICSTEIGYPASGLKEIFKWPVADTKITKLLYHCIRLNTGYSNKDGQLIIEKYMSLKIMKGTEEQIKNAMEECNKIKLEDPAETAFAIGVCLHKYCTFGAKNEKTGDINMTF